MEKRIVIVPVIMVVYKNKFGWRGFCAPYDVTCYADTSDEAKKRIKEIVSLYEEGLKKYRNPKHLIYKNLSNKTDKQVLRKIWPEVIATVQRKTLRTYESFVNATTEEKKTELAIKQDGTKFVSYLQRSLVPQY